MPLTHSFQATDNPLGTDFPEIAVISTTSKDKTNVDFRAIKVGDIDFSAKSGNWQELRPRQNKPTLFLDIENQKFEAGELVTVSFRTNKFEKIQGYQFELGFDKDYIDYRTYQNGSRRSSSRIAGAQQQEQQQGCGENSSNRHP